MSVLLGKAEGRFSETTIDEEIVVMQLDTGVFFSLTGTARRIWELLDGTRDHATLLAELVEEYGTETQPIAADLEAFLDQLKQADLLT